MSTFKIRMVTETSNDTYYRRLNVPRESYVDVDVINRIVLKHGGTKRRSILPATDKSYIEEKKDLISGLVFDSRKNAEKFMKKKKSTLERLAKQNPIYKKYEVFTIQQRFMPDESKLKYWDPNKEDF